MEYTVQYRSWSGGRYGTRVLEEKMTRSSNIGESLSMFPNLQEPRSREERKAVEAGGESLEKVRLRQKGIDAPADVVKPVTNRCELSINRLRLHRAPFC